MSLMPLLFKLPISSSVGDTAFSPSISSMNGADLVPSIYYLCLTYLWGNSLIKVIIKGGRTMEKSKTITTISVFIAIVIYLLAFTNQNSKTENKKITTQSLAEEANQKLVVLRNRKSRN